MLSLKGRAQQLHERLSPCRLCPHHCGIDRSSGQTGKCRTGNDVSVASCNLHFGEEPPISGTRGSGTIFFSNCNLSCVICQNYPISHLGNGNRFSIDKLARAMCELQSKGAHNINVVTPTHVTPQIVEALAVAREAGLTIPLVYNCGGYEDIDTLRLLDGVVDIYLPDMKYADDRNAATYSGAPGYWEINTNAIREMYRQVGDLEVDADGIAHKGLIIRHLILPGGISGSREVLSFIARELSPNVHLSLMAQYHPAHRSNAIPELSRRITPEEYDEILAYTEKLGMENGWRQEL